MTVFRIPSLVALVTVMLFLNGCASVQLASDAEDAEAKKFAAKSGMARIYVYRNETMGAAVKMTVSINGQVLGETASKTYFIKDVNPGTYTIKSHTENSPEIKVNAEAGKIYFVWQEVKMGMWAARSMLHLVDQNVGREGVMESKLATASK